jgi:peroxiredoxin
MAGRFPTARERIESGYGALMPSGSRSLGRWLGTGWLLSLVASAAVGLVGCSSVPVSAGMGAQMGVVTIYPVGGRKSVPPLAGSTLDGRQFRLSNYMGQVVVLNFWGAWCSYCRAEAPALGEVAASFQSRGVTFVGVDVRDDSDAARAFAQNVHANYPSVRDSSGQLQLAFGAIGVPPTAVPSTIIIDRSGRIAARVIGPTTQPRLSALLTSVLAG